MVLSFTITISVLLGDGGPDKAESVRSSNEAMHYPFSVGPLDHMQSIPDLLGPSASWLI